MAVSKRVRYEVLRRDNHACRYCGGAAPDVKLVVDHVVPVALGGSDDPSNLVAACADCNSGKTSTSPDALLVSEVSATAVAWSKAMQQAAEERGAIYAHDRKIAGQFRDIWEQWTWTNYKGEKRVFELPAGFDASIRQFLSAGLTFADLEELVGVAMASRADKWKYFCGCCWRRIRQAQERAQQILAVDPQGESVRLLEIADYDVPDLWLVVLQEWLATGRDKYAPCTCPSGEYCGDLACMLKHVVIAARELAEEKYAALRAEHEGGDSA